MNSESSDVRNSVDHVCVDYQAELGAITHKGHVRSQNEDSYLLIRFGRSLENVMTNLEDHLLKKDYSVSGYGLLVADGMGGMAGGQVASRMTLAKLVELIVDTSDWTLRMDRESDANTVMRRMSDRFLKIDQALREEAAVNTSLRGMGTTLTVAGLLGRELVIGHVGDSRAYLLSAGNLKQLTTDHTMAQALIDAGVAKYDDPATRSMRHVLTAAIGAMGDGHEPQVQRYTLADSDQLLLCTDGLTEIVDDATIARVLSEAESAQAACETLLDLALEGGGPDNITVVVLRLRAPLPASKS
ncbi:MAG TPA: protein phosphatase 2C domain-containing protein [Pyrinomonadaceae bacterium]